MMPMLTRSRPVPADPRLATVLGDPDRSPMALTFRAALLLLASREIGQNVDRLAARTGTSRSFVARCARRLLDHGVWADGETVCEWGDEGAAHPSFWNDVAVAEGKMCRHTGESGAFEWVPAGDRIKFYEYRDAAEPRGARYVPHPRGVPQSAPAWDPAEDEEAEPQIQPVAAAREVAPPAPAVALAPDLPAVEPAPGESSPPAPERPRPNSLADDPVGRLFPDAQWMG